MAPGKKIGHGSSCKSVAARIINGNVQRNNLNNVNPQDESARRQEILYLVSQNLIDPQFARFAWFESIERDIQQLRLDLQALEKATKGGEHKCGNGKNQVKRKANNGR